MQDDIKEGIPVTILETNYQSIFMRVGKYNIEIKGERFLEFVFNGHYYYGTGYGKEFLQVLYEDNQVYIHLIDMLNLTEEHTKMKRFNGLLKYFGAPNIVSNIETLRNIMIIDTIRSCYYSLCHTKSFGIYDGFVKPNIGFLKNNIPHETWEQKQIHKYLGKLENLEIKLIANELGRNENPE